MDDPNFDAETADLLAKLEDAGFSRAGGGDASGGGVGEVAGATRAALAMPTDFPPVDQIIVPGDHLVVLLSGRTPAAAAIVGAVIDSVVGVGPSAIDVVVDDADRCGIDGDALAEAYPDVDVRLIEHDGDDRESLSYVAADVDALPIYLNRSVADADWVLPVIVDGSIGGDSASSLLHPAFTDTAARRRHRDASHTRPPSDNPATLIGVQLTLHVRVDDAGGVAGVEARMNQPADSDGMGVDGGAEGSHDAALGTLSAGGAASWAAVVDALQNTASHVAPGGRVAVWTGRLPTPPEPVRQLLEDELSPEDLPDPEDGDPFDPDHDLARRLGNVLQRYSVAFGGAGDEVEMVAASSAATGTEVVRWLGLDGGEPGVVVTAADRTARRVAGDVAALKDSVRAG